MGIWLRRISALTLISLGISLIFCPFNDTRSGTIDTEVVLLQKQTLLNPDEIQAQFPDQQITDIAGPGLNPDDYPDLWRAFINLKHYEYTDESGDLEEWNRFQDSVLQQRKQFRLVVFRESLITCSIGKDQGAGDGASEVALFTHLGRYNPNIKEISESDLAAFPGITRLVKILEAGDGPDTELVSQSATISMDEWDQLAKQYLDPLGDSQTFSFNNNFYGPEFETDYTQIEGSISYLGTLLKALGVVSLLAGFLLVKKLYIRKKGIMVNPQGIALLYDGITMLFAIPSVYMVVSVLLAKTLHIPPLVTDDFGIFMGVFFFCVGIPALTLYTSRFTAQSVEINSEGIHVDSLMGKNSITWDSFDSMDFSDEYIVVGRGGMLMPRQLQKCLTVKATAGQSVTINEPQLSMSRN